MSQGELGNILGNGYFYYCDYDQVPGIFQNMSTLYISTAYCNLVTPRKGENYRLNSSSVSGHLLQEKLCSKSSKVILKGKYGVMHLHFGKHSVYKTSTRLGPI